MYDLVIVGTGISGIRSAFLAKEYGLEKVLLVDYRDEPGGFISPFFHSFLFQEEKKWVDRVAELPYPVWTQSTVVGLFPGENDQPHQLFVQRTNGTETIKTKYLLIASGSMEKPREAHRIPGTRPAGIMTPYLAMEFLKRGELPGKQILALGDTRMHQAIVAALLEKGCAVTHFSHKDAELAEVKGLSRVTGATILKHSTGDYEEWTGDTIIYSKDRIPCTFFLKGTPVLRDPHHAVIIDDEGATNMPRIYATGSCTILGKSDHGNSIHLAEKHLGALWREVLSQ